MSNQDQGALPFRTMQESQLLWCLYPRGVLTWL